MSRLPLAACALAIALVVSALIVSRPEAHADGVADASLKATLSRLIGSKVKVGQPEGSGFTYPEGQMVGVADDHLVYKAGDALVYIPLRSIRGVHSANRTLSIDLD